ncbi:hypothetical protein JEQ12_014301 [Ovis aries]|uniref:Uncharacterized protein n=1 Tax=Ovis aries TaxID=9940 RepID=A0A836AJ66_SHEEP|nr:hypothetical protein JEQ12_014301 [Ovis aries]
MKVLVFLALVAVSTFLVSGQDTTEVPADSSPEDTTEVPTDTSPDESVLALHLLPAMTISHLNLMSELPWGREDTTTAPQDTPASEAAATSSTDPSESTDAPSESTDAPTTTSAGSTSTAASSTSAASITTRFCKVCFHVLTYFAELSVRWNQPRPSAFDPAGLGQYVP